MPSPARGRITALRPVPAPVGSQPEVPAFVDDAEPEAVSSVEAIGVVGDAETSRAAETSGAAGAAMTSGAAGAAMTPGAAGAATVFGPQRTPDSGVWRAADPDDAPLTGLGSALLRRGPWGALAERWVPETLPRPRARIGPGRRGAVLLALVAAIAAVVAAIGVWRERPQPRPVTPVALQSPQEANSGTPASGDSGSSRSGSGGSMSGASTTALSGLSGSPPAAGTGESTAAAASPSTTTAPPTTSEPAEIVVSVTGLVRHPGLVRLASGSRVADAVAAAGGVVGQGDVTGLNLATRLLDGASVVVGEAGHSALTDNAPNGATAAAGVPPPAQAGPAASGAPSLIDLNSADEAALDALPGVGPVTAAAIVAYRDQHGPFSSVDELQAIPGIGPAKFAQISPHVTVGPAP